jgi:hypothetical protein
VTNKLALLTVIIPLALGAGCTKKNAAPPAPASGAASASVAPEAGSQDITGPVLETMNSGQYTYVRVGSPSGEIWAAAQRFDVKVGDRVVIKPETPMRNFHSQTLNRDFPLIYFTTSIGKEGEQPAARGGGQMPMAPSHGSAPSSAAPAEPIAQPAGATSIADVWAQRKALAGKTITAKGKVVKYNGEILGRNWVHLQDGTGKAADGSNDLTVTTTDETQVGDVITVTGKVSIDKDFTAGYAYPVILEDARIARKG